MTDGEVRVVQHGKEAIVDTPALAGSIDIDVDAGPDGGATLRVPTNTAVIPQDEQNSERDERAETDGGQQMVDPTVRLRGGGFPKDYTTELSVLGFLTALAGGMDVVTDKTVAGVLALICGVVMLYFAARAHFALKATGGDDE